MCIVKAEDICTGGVCRIETRTDNGIVKVPETKLFDSKGNHRIVTDGGSSAISVMSFVIKKGKLPWDVAPANAFMF